MIDPQMIAARTDVIVGAQVGVLELTIRRGNGTEFTFAATLLPTPQACANMNSREYYKRHPKPKDRHKAIIAEHLTWMERVERSIDRLYVVDADLCVWRCISIKSLVGYRFR